MKLTIELIPRSSWDVNLRSYLTKSQWDKVRRKCYQNAGYRCEICNGVGTKHPVECHERWEFENGQVKLLGLIALCPSCHEVKHIGRADAVGRGPQALAHLMKVNELTESEAMGYVRHAFRIWQDRSKRQWELNIDYLEEYMGEKFVKEAKERKGDK